MKAYFSRRVPFYILAPEEVTDSVGFDAYEVDVAEGIINFAQDIRLVVKIMEETFAAGGAPEESAQLEADKFARLVDGV